MEFRLVLYRSSQAVQGALMGLSVVVEGIGRVSRQLGSKVGCGPAEQGGELAPGDRSRRTVGAVAPPVDDAQRGKAVDGAGVRAPTGDVAEPCRGHLGADAPGRAGTIRSEEHTSELQSLMRISYAVFCLKKKNT